jgi:hypothetical protein
MNTRRTFFTPWIVAVALLISRAAYAQGDIQSVDSLARFQAIPDNLALQLIGLPGTSIQQPGTLPNVLASIANSVDRQGHLTPGLGVSIAPYRLIYGDTLQLRTYVDSWWEQVLTNSQLSFGTAAATDIDSALDWAVGAKIVLWNSGDERQNKVYINNLVERATELFDQARIPKVGSTFSESDRQANTTRLKASLTSLQTGRAALDSARQTAYRWNGTFLELDAGFVYRAINQYVQASALSRWQAWMNGGWGTGSLHMMLQVGVNSQNLITRDVPTMTLHTDTTTGRVDTMRGSVLETIQRDSLSLLGALMIRYGNPNLRIGIGISRLANTQNEVNLLSEIRLGNNSWIVASVNGEIGDHKPTWKPNLTLKATASALGL